MRWELANGRFALKRPSSMAPVIACSIGRAFFGTLGEYDEIGRAASVRLHEFGSAQLADGRHDSATH